MLPKLGTPLTSKGKVSGKDSEEKGEESEESIQHLCRRAHMSHFMEFPRDEWVYANASGKSANFMTHLEKSHVFLLVTKNNISA